MSCCGSCGAGKPCESGCAAQPHLPGQARGQHVADRNPFEANDFPSLEQALSTAAMDGWTQVAPTTGPTADNVFVLQRRGPTGHWQTARAFFEEGKWHVGTPDIMPQRALAKGSVPIGQVIAGADIVMSGSPFAAEHSAGETARVLYEVAEERKPQSMPQNGVCGPFARIAVDPGAAMACQRLGNSLGAIDTPQKLYKLVHSEYFTYANETFIIVPLDVHYQLLPVKDGGVMPPVRIGEGQRSRVTIDPADVLRAALLSMCHRYAVLHNHPASGEHPSDADKALSRTLERSHDACFGRDKGVDPTCEWWGHFVVWRGGITDARTGKKYVVKG